MSIIAAELTLIDENTALRARVAKLEEALRLIRRYAEEHDDEFVPFVVDEALAAQGKAMSDHLTIIVGEYTISKLRSGEAVEFDNNLTILPASDLANIESIRAEAALAERETVNRINWYAFGSDQMSEPELRRSMIKIEEISAASIRARTGPLPEPPKVMGSDDGAGQSAGTGP